MAVVPVRRLALLGGGFSTDDDGLLDDWVLGHARGSRPKVCFAPTASGDAPGYVEEFLTAFPSRTCEPSVLSLFRRELDDDALRTFLSDGLGLLSGSVCPHYDSEPGRSPSYRAAVATGALPAGWALADGVGALFTDGVLTETVARTPEARLYQVAPDGHGGVNEQALSGRLLTGAPRERSNGSWANGS
ncbi:Type 1 glutamine amidotransferase-like domain-containing protein [Streptomyces sp. NPDC048506]|uniref:Type 1 glutamine amidotransferase-like domain-containing protein n=1 Tax=Streptomyces sp. NPDC048506 TaxID=3155028 RepID=UPI00342EB1B0